MLSYLSVNEIEIPVVKVRGVCDDNPEYADLLLSIQKHGVLVPISVRVLEDGKHSLVDGLQRLSCAKRCDHEVIPAIIDERIKDEDDSLLKSLLANLQRVNMRPYEYANALRLYVKRRPDMDIEQLADLLSKSRDWICDRLSLTKLVPAIGVMVDEKQVSVRKAQGLALLPAEEQLVVLREAGEMTSDEFYNLCLERRRAERLIAPPKQSQGQTASFEATPILRKRAVLADELITLSAGKDLCTEDLQPMDAWRLAIAWAIQMDPRSKEARKADWENRLKTQKAKHKKIDKELT